MSTTKSKFRFVKLIFNLILLSTFGVILYQNNHSVPVELLAWKADVSLTFLLLGIALLGALITFITVVIIGRR